MTQIHTYNKIGREGGMDIKSNLPVCKLKCMACRLTVDRITGERKERREGGVCFSIHLNTGP